MKADDTSASLEHCPPEAAALKSGWGGIPRAGRAPRVHVRGALGSEIAGTWPEALGRGQRRRRPGLPGEQGCPPGGRALPGGGPEPGGRAQVRRAQGGTPGLISATVLKSRAQTLLGRRGGGRPGSRGSCVQGPPPCTVALERAVRVVCGWPASHTCHGAWRPHKHPGAAPAAAHARGRAPLSRTGLGPSCGRQIPLEGLKLSLPGLSSEFPSCVVVLIENLRPQGGFGRRDGAGLWGPAQNVPGLPAQTPARREVSL